MTTENRINEMSMEPEINAIRRLLEKVKARVAEGKDEVNECKRQLDGIGNDLASSGEYLKSIKKSFSVGNLIKAKMKGISAEEARNTAEVFCEYADTVTHISDEQRKQAEVQQNLAKATDTVTKREFVQGRIEDLMDAIGAMD